MTPRPVFRWKASCSGGCRALHTNDMNEARRWVHKHAIDLGHRPATFVNQHVRWAALS